MKVYYDSELVMPSNYVIMDDQEMTYLEGGAYKSSKQTMKAARKFFNAMRYANGVGTVSSIIGTCLGMAVLACTAAYFGAILTQANSCYTQVCSWIASSKYTNSSKCTVVVTTVFGGIPSGLSVSV